MVGGCCVCSDERGWAENPLVYCDGHACSVAVHQGKARGGSGGGGGGRRRGGGERCGTPGAARAPGALGRALRSPPGARAPPPPT